MSRFRERKHHLTLTDRNATGDRHRHRWAVSCSCGWSGVHRRRRKEAKGEWGQHVRSVTVDAARRRLVAPGVLTPDDRLPETLRTRRGPES